MASINDLSLAKGLTAKVEEACAGLETGEAPILDHVSEITAELLKWWFQTEFQDARTFNFHPGQRQALLNVIYAHEVLGIASLQDLYQFVYNRTGQIDNDAITNANWADGAIVAYDKAKE